MNGIKEIWKDVPGFEKLYQVSSYGRLKSFARYKNSKQKERILKIRICNHGYSRLALHRKGKTKYMFAHRMVMLVFVGPSDLQVNHKDENPLNNHIDNLEYVNASQNRIYSLNKKATSSKFVGVVKTNGMWVARVTHEGKRFFIGKFKKEIDAHHAYVNFLNDKGIKYMTPRTSAI